MAFVATDKMPGVYIDEIQLPGPIPGIATNNVAIIGPAETGPTNKPTLVTNPTQFANTFGGYLTSPQMYFASHAVQGFFINGGTKCYFVRIGKGRRARRFVLDSSGDASATTPIPDRPTLLVTAKNEGTAGNIIEIKIDDASVADSSRVLVHFAAAVPAGDIATVADATGFAVGDTVVLHQGANTENATIKEITPPVAPATATTLKFRAVLQHAYTTAGTVRHSTIPKQQTRIQLSSVAGIEAGSYIRFSGSTGGGTPTTIEENRVVASVGRANRIVVLEKALENDYEPKLNLPVRVATLEFSLAARSTVTSEQFANLSMDPRHSRYFEKVTALKKSELIEVTPLSDPPNPTLPPNDRPRATGAWTALWATGDPAEDAGVDDDRIYQTSHFIDGISALEIVDEVNMVCVPDDTSTEVQAKLIGHCEKMQDRFAILDCPAGLDVTEIRNHRDTLQTDRGFGALYYPRIKIRDPNPNYERLITVPPSGHIAGVYARTDEQKGVHKAPANEVLKGVLELEHTLTDTDSGILNEQSINVLHFFRGRGFRIWGGRTLAVSTQWRYVNVRRLMLFIEESIQEACEAFVFDPNNLSLWETIKRQLNGFLTQVWQNGALFGATPKQAFRVRIDEELNPPETRALGQLFIEVIVFPTTPAEFIVFRVIQEPGGPRLIEL